MMMMPLVRAATAAASLLALFVVAAHAQD